MDAQVPAKPLRTIDRMLAVDRLVNARDLDGIPGVDRRTTPTAVFSRSENLDRAAITGWELRRGDPRAAASGRADGEPAGDALCRTVGTTREGAIRSALAGLDVPAVLAAAGLTDAEPTALHSWRHSLAD